ncbi:MlaD family protein [Mycolicibacterium anyangense]|nr:MlaD family protein [Mycolicibacterium anyangense]
MRYHLGVSLHRAALSGATLAAVAAAAVSCATPSASPASSNSADYCAVMPDSIGLYVGNPVTQMGFPIGKVKSVTPSAKSVRVDFTLTDDRPLPSDVRAVVRSPSVLADRALEMVGNYEKGPRLKPGECVPLDRSLTPKSLSQVIGSTTEFVNAINPKDSTNVGGTVAGLDQLMRGNGEATNKLLTSTSALLDSPDRAISEMGSIVTNLADLTTFLSDVRGPMKQILLDAVTTTPDLNRSLDGGTRLVRPFPALITAVGDLEQHAGDEIQLTLDSMSDALRKMTPHANAMADLFNPVPWWINTFANHVNNRGLSIRYRPPMYRIPTHDGLLQCGYMNAQVPGSCMDVAGQPYAVDVALLQYVLTMANKR